MFSQASVKYLASIIIKERFFLHKPKAETPKIGFANPGNYLHFEPTHSHIPAGPNNLIEDLKKSTPL